MVHMRQVSGNDIQDEGCGHKILFVLLGLLICCTSVFFLWTLVIRLLYMKLSSGSFFAYCKRSKTGAREGLGTRL